MVRILDVVEHATVGPEELAWREPQRGSGDFRLGSQCIVRDNQAAVFVRDGQALDALHGGRHTLSTGNIPLLVSLLGVAFSGESPFKAEVYFINLADFPQVGWGTTQPLALQTPGQGLGWMLLQAHGVMDIRVAEPQRFATQYCIGRPVVRLGDIKERLLTMVMGDMQETITAASPGNLMKLNSLISEIEGAMLAKSAAQFAAVGLSIKAFDIKALTPKTTTADDLRSMGLLDVATYTQLQAADAMRDAAQSPGGAAGTGVGIGAGLGLGQAMAQTIAGATQQQAGEQTPATPQTAAEIQAMIDNLDTRFANGEMSEVTYNRLVAKWEARLKELGE
jgi:membrane protease subunit (stomatin/prohibitin family)